LYLVIIVCNAFSVIRYLTRRNYFCERTRAAFVNSGISLINDS